MIRIFDPRDKMRHYWRLDKGTYTIGRKKDCDLFIDDYTVSKLHARLEIDDDQEAIITDLNSHNGTVVNGIMISGPAKLKDNDTIELGSIKLKFISGELSAESRNLVSLTEHDDLTSVTLLPMKKALQPLPSRFFEDPKVFNSLFEFGKMLIIPGDDESILNNGLALLKEVIPVERAAIFGLEGGEERVSLSAHYVAKGSKSGVFSISRTVLHELLDNKEAVLISDVQADTKYREQQSIISSGIRSAMAVPLYDEGKVFGVLYADTSRAGHGYTEDHLRVMATFGNMLAAKITNNTLLGERREKEILESELAVASQIQEQLLPKSIPQIEGYNLSAFQVQCREVGGDLYDISELNDGRILILLADVSGKGMGAALLASNILAAFRALYSSGGFRLLDATRAVSEQLLKFSRPGDFATLFVGVLDPEGNSLQYINAGHNPPLFTCEEGTLKYLEASGIPVGVMASDTWKEESIEIRPGESIHIYTDGIPEAANREGEQFGDERLEKFILENRHKTPEEMVKFLIGEVDNFVGNHPRSDDISLIILGRQT